MQKTSESRGADHVRVVNAIVLSKLPRPNLNIKPLELQTFSLPIAQSTEQVEIEAFRASAKVSRLAERKNIR